MASSRNAQSVQWSSSASVTCNNNTARFTSDPVALNIEDWEAAITVYGNCAGTPSAADYMEIYILWNGDDIDANAADDFDTDEHGEYLGRLDFFASNTPGENPAQRTFHIPTACKGFKLSLLCPNSTTRNVTARARLQTHRGQ